MHDCPSCVPRCEYCDRTLAGVSELQAGLCYRCILELRSTVPLEVLVEDPDERPYIWDLEDNPCQ